MTKDCKKKIAIIQYNTLNLPDKLQFTYGNTTDYLYDAAGDKLSVTYTTANINLLVPMGSIVPVQSENILTTSRTDYCGNLIYEDGVLSRIITEEGYVTFSGSNPVYHYYLKDHEGNNRVVLNQNRTVEQVNNYYPFGGLYGDNTGGSVQPYMYNGKELDRMHGLDLFDYGARHYDAALGRWFTVDPLCEKYYGVRLYVYCANNPVLLVDPDGMEKIEALDKNDPDYKDLLNAANKFKDDPRVVNIWVHGNKKGIKMYYTNNKYKYITTSKDFEKFLNANSSVWRSRRKDEYITIVLHSCDTGNEMDGNSDSFARQLSRDLKNTFIIAPDSPDSFNKFGESGPKLETKTIGGKSYIKRFGRWIEFCKGDLINVYSGETDAGSVDFRGLLQRIYEYLKK